jgi:hypothetical protein
VRGGKESGENVGGDRCVGQELAHVAAFTDRAVHRAPLVFAELVPRHAGQLRWQDREVSSSRADVLITATELRRLMAAGEPVTILDVRWQLAEPDGRPAYVAGHVPGAVYCSLDDDLTDHAV